MGSFFSSGRKPCAKVAVNKCYLGFQFSESGKEEDCSQLCLTHCNQWASQFLVNMPKVFTLFWENTAWTRQLPVDNVLVRVQRLQPAPQETKEFKIEWKAFTKKPTLEVTITDEPEGGPESEEFFAATTVLEHQSPDKAAAVFCKFLQQQPNATYQISIFAYVRLQGYKLTQELARQFTGVRPVEDLHTISFWRLWSQPVRQTIIAPSYSVAEIQLEPLTVTFGPVKRK
jgi:hypothetical protein